MYAFISFKTNEFYKMVNNVNLAFISIEMTASCFSVHMYAMTVHYLRWLPLIIAVSWQKMEANIHRTFISEQVTGGYWFKDMSHALVNMINRETIHKVSLDRYFWFTGYKIYSIQQTKNLEATIYFVTSVIWHKFYLITHRVF